MKFKQKLRCLKKRLPLTLQNMIKRTNLMLTRPLYKRLPLAMPLSIHIDPSNLCNFQCIFCPTGNSELLSSVKRFKGIMNPELFYKIIDDCALMVSETNTRFRHVHLYKDGEPLINPDFIQMVTYVKQKDIARIVSTTTNGSILTEELSLALINSKIDAIRISIEQCDEKGYKKITKTFSDFQGLRKKIAYLYNEKKRRSSRMYITVKITDTQLSFEEKDKFMNLFRPICDEIKIDSLMGWSMSDKKDFTMGLPVTTAMNGVTPLKEKTICPEPFSKLAVNPDGTVSVCCVDWAYATIIGDLKKQTLSQIWHGEELQKFRLMHLTGKRAILPACASCQYILGFPDAENIDAHSIKLTEIYRKR